MKKELSDPLSEKALQLACSWWKRTHWIEQCKIRTVKWVKWVNWFKVFWSSVCCRNYVTNFFMILLFLNGEKTMPFATFFNFQGSCVISQGQLLCKYLLTHSLIQASCCWELVFIYCLSSGFADQFESLLWKKEILFVWRTAQIGSLQFHSWSSTCFMEKCFQG